MIEKLQALMEGVTEKTDAEDLLHKVQKIVFGTDNLLKRNWDTPFRIDDFDFTSEGCRLSVGDGALRTTYCFGVFFSTQQKLKLVA